MNSSKIHGFPLCCLSETLPQFPFMWNQNFPTALTRILEYLSHTQHFKMLSLQIINEYRSIILIYVFFFSLSIPTFKIHEDFRRRREGTEGQIKWLQAPWLYHFSRVYDNRDLSASKKPILFSKCAVMKWNLHSAYSTSGQREALSPSKIVHFKSFASSTAIYLILIKVLSWIIKDQIFKVIN